MAGRKSANHDSVLLEERRGQDGVFRPIKRLWLVLKAARRVRVNHWRDQIGTLGRLRLFPTLTFACLAVHDRCGLAPHLGRRAFPGGTSSLRRPCRRQQGG